MESKPYTLSEYPTAEKHNLPVPVKEGRLADGSIDKQKMLESHVLFWDRDGDGIISVFDTYRGFSELGYAVFWSVLSVFIIHSGFSFCSGDSWIPDPLFRIKVKNIHRCKHGSDSGSYNTEGHFVQGNFDDIFAKYGNGKDGLTFREGFDAIRGNRNIMDPFGWFAIVFEWGSIFFKIAEKEKQRSQALGSGFTKFNESNEYPLHSKTQ